MKISLNWLADYVELPASADELASKLTMAGLEVEGIERLGTELAGVVVAQVIETGPHPNAEKLSVVRVHAGPLGELPIVCGAKNYKAGDKVPLATLGTQLPGGPKIAKATLRGVESFGMLCSAKDLGISEDHSGLMILDPALTVGQPIADALGLKDVVFDVNISPNRGDCLSHIGVAREVAALTGKPLKLPRAPLVESGVSADELVRVKVEDPERCPRYAARVIEGVAIGPSPIWIQNRLRAVGIRAISNAVDVTNFVLMECGQPLHAFDLDRVAGAEIIVRRAKANEKMTTLDGKERTLSPEDLCICDAKGPSALAGVMGGAVSEVSDKTRRILLESAWFAPTGIRRTAQRHALHSESSHRFERRVDPEMVLFAQDRATSLLAELCQATVAKGRVDVCAAPPRPRSLKLRFAKISELLGTEVPKEKTEQILSSLGFGLKPEGVGAASIEPPSWRGDVECEADCVEEVARIQGYQSVPAMMPRGAAELLPDPAAQTIEARVRIALAASGLDEVVNYSFVAPKDLEVLSPGEQPIPLKNPLAAEQSVMCTTRLAGLLTNLRRSRNRQVEDVRLYEIGRIYLRPSGGDQRQPANEPRMLAGVMYGARAPLQWGEPRAPIDFYDLKGAVEQVLEAACVRGASFAPGAANDVLHPRSACEVRFGGKLLGTLGELHPAAAQKLDLPRGVYVFELDFDALVAAAQLVPQYQAVPRFPAVLRDLAVAVDEAVPAASVEETIRQAGGGLVEEVVLFDLYRGEKIAAGKKSLAFAIRYRASGRTLTDEEANKAHALIVARLSERYGAELRA